MAEPLRYSTLDRKGRATLPEEVRKALGVEAGDLILLERRKHGTFELVPASLVPKDQLWFHHSEEERSRERRRRIVGHRGTSWEDAELWDVELWQSMTPEEQLSALVATRRDVELVEARRDPRPEEL